MGGYFKKSAKELFRSVSKSKQRPTPSKSRSQEEAQEYPRDSFKINIERCSFIGNTFSAITGTKVALFAKQATSLYHEIFKLQVIANALAPCH